MYYQIFRLLPKNSLSRMVGILASRPWPKWALEPLIRLYISIFQIDMNQFAEQPGGFATFNDFFTRPLKPEARPITPDPLKAASPVDGRVSQMGIINQGKLIQAKGMDYTLEELLDNDPSWREYDGGSFLTLYLSPRDYHRIHSPVAGRVTRFVYVPGELWSVSPSGVRNVPRLFSSNERLITVLETQFGEMLLVAVGATIVGKIKVVYHSITSNLKGAKGVSETLAEPYQVDKGGELGRFEMGSTVILLFRPGQAQLENLTPGQPVKMGQAIADFS